MYYRAFENIHMLFKMTIMLRFFLIENTSMVDFFWVFFLVQLLYGHLVLKFQVFDTKPQKIICSFFLTSDDFYFYIAIHPLEKPPHFH